MKIRVSKICWPVFHHVGAVDDAIARSIEVASPVTDKKSQQPMNIDGLAADPQLLAHGTPPNIARKIRGWMGNHVECANFSGIHPTHYFKSSAEDYNTPIKEREAFA